jgi:hypothetical protein
MVLIEGVSAETWVERVGRLLREPEEQEGGSLSPELKERMAISDAQFRADKEMLDEIHLMLRHICERMGA